MNLSTISIATQLRSGFGTLALLLGIIAGVALTKIAAIDEAFDVALDQEYPMIVRLVDMERQVNLIARATRNALLISDPAGVKKEAESVAAARQKIGALLDKIGRAHV